MILSSIASRACHGASVTCPTIRSSLLLSIPVAVSAAAPAAAPGPSAGTATALGNVRLLATESSTRTAGSSSGSGGGSGGGVGNDATPAAGRQDFVKVRIEPGQWDREHTDPTYLPPWKKNRARIISAEDFANRPRAGFSNEFASPYDAMATVCWMTQEDRDGVYKMYLDMMEAMSKSDRGVTSHEYAMRVVAQKFHISAERAAAIVQLQHNEDRIRKDHPEKRIYYEVQEYVDAKIREHVHKLYDFHKQPAPVGFVEDPIGVDGLGDPDRRVRGSRRAEDLYDVDAMVRAALIREKEEAVLAVEGHTYIEDVDDSLRTVKLDANADKFLKEARRAREGQHAQKQEDAEAPAKKAVPSSPSDAATTTYSSSPVRGRPAEISPLPNNGRGIAGVWAQNDDPSSPGRRPRWKYVAKIIDTSNDAKKVRKDKKLKKRIHKGTENTIVEHGGNVRPATVEEANAVSWKPVRNVKEFMYRGVKKAWLDRALRGNMDGWGKVERDLEREKLAEAKRRMGKKRVSDEEQDVEEGSEEKEQ